MHSRDSTSPVTVMDCVLHSPSLRMPAVLLRTEDSAPAGRTALHMRGCTMSSLQAREFASSPQQLPAAAAAHALLAPTRSRGMRRSSEPCFRNTLPAHASSAEGGERRESAAALPAGTPSRRLTRRSMTGIAWYAPADCAGLIPTPSASAGERTSASCRSSTQRRAYRTVRDDRAGGRRHLELRTATQRRRRRSGGAAAQHQRRRST